LVVAHVFTIKLDHELSEVGYHKIIEWTRSTLPKRNRMNENFYTAKLMMKPLGLGYQKINMCLNFCMFYYLENTDLIKCKTCGHAWYKPRIGKGRNLVTHRKLRYFPLTSRLQRLFMSTKIVEHMTWNHSHDAVDRAMKHLFDGET
jgi:hypothetical protein